MSNDFSNSDFMKKQLTIAQKTLDESLEIAQGLLANLPEESDIRTTSIIVGAGFELLYDLMLKFRFQTERFADEWMINKKRDVLESEGILPQIFSSDMKMIIKIRNHCSHSFTINETEIKKMLHGTMCYQRNEQVMKGKSLGGEFRLVSTLILNTVRVQFSHYIADHLNKLEGWK